MTRLYYLVLPIVLFGGSFSALCQDRPSVFQSWNEVQLIVPLIRSEDAGGRSVDKVTAIFNGIARFGRAELVDGRLGAEMDYRANQYLTRVASALERRDAQL